MEVVRMKIECPVCGNEINLDHGVFKEYAGPIKCFSCGGMMEIRTVHGAIDSLSLLGVSTAQSAVS